MVFVLAATGLGWAAPRGVTPSPAAWSGALPVAGATPDVYVDAVALVAELYLEPARLDPHAMLARAAEQVAADLDWLQVRDEGGALVLEHGSGAPIGRVTVESLTDLPLALAHLEALVEGSGYGLGGADVRRSVLTGFAQSLDRHSRLLTDERLDRFQTRLAGTQVGIGATLARAGDHLVVTELSDGGPAELAGLQLGDRIVRIDGRSTVGLTAAEAAERVRGAEGSAVALVVSRDGAEHAFTFARAEVVIPNVAWRVLPGQVGYVFIEHVSQRTVENLQVALAGLREAGALDHGLIIDLRGNTGGSMKESARVADLFVREGLLLRTVGRDGGPVQNLQPEMVAYDDGTEPELPLVLVVDERTASGSEILAGALVELGRAAVIGTRTYGKGTVQKIYPLGPDVRLKLTVARYILANGRVIAERSEDGGGIEPDVWMGKVTVRGSDVRYDGWSGARTRAEWERIVPEVQLGADAGDLAVEIGRRAVLAAHGPRRAEILAALRVQATQARREQGARLASVLAPFVDWSAEASPGGMVQADVRLRADRLEGGDRWAVTASVTNRGAVPLHRALVQLQCDSAPWWDGVVVPLGVLPVHTQVDHTVVVEVPPGVEPREDVVHVRVVAEGREFGPAIGERVLPSASTPTPELAVRARLVPAGPDGGPYRAELAVENRSAAAIPTLAAHFGFPEDRSIELVDEDASIGALPPYGAASVSLALAVDPGAPALLPLELVLDSVPYGALADWPLALPRDGTWVALAAPEIDARPAVRASPIGRFVLPIVVTDDRRVDHVVVVANGEKVAWAAGGGARVDVAARFPLVLGDNEIVVTAEDDQGLVRSLRVGIRGEPTPDTVDAGQ